MSPLNTLCSEVLVYDELFWAILIGERGPVCKWSGDRLSSAGASLGDAAGRGTTGGGTEPSAEEKQSSGEEDWETTNWATAPERDADTGMCSTHKGTIYYEVSMIHTHDYCIYLAITRLRWRGGNWGISCHRQTLEFWYDGENTFVFYSGCLSVMDCHRSTQYLLVEYIFITI